MSSPSSFPSPSPSGSTFSDYTHSGRASTGGGGVASGEGYWSIEKCKKAYSQYIANKSQEIEEQKNARRYYHGVQHTSEIVRELNKRKQPIVTFNRIARKLNGVVGTIDRLKQDPKAYPRTPQDADKAELGTAIIRYALDSENWNAKSPEVALDCSIEGLSGISIRLEEKQRETSAQPYESSTKVNRDDNGNSPLGAPSYKDDTTQGGVGGGGSISPGKPPEPNEAGQKDYEVSFDVIETDSFFYDPRSYRADFSDARYMGEAKWLDLETAQELFPDHAEDLASSVEEDGNYLSTNPDPRDKILCLRRWQTPD